MTKFFLAISLILLFTNTTQPENYMGKWKIKGGSIIEIYQTGNKFYGKIFKRAENPIANLNGLDNQNPDSTLRNRPLIGMNILNNLRFKDGELSGGTIYNADSGKTYTVRVWIEEDDLNICYIRAYKGFLYKTFVAKRIIEPN